MGRQRGENKREDGRRRKTNEKKSRDRRQAEKEEEEKQRRKAEKKGRGEGRAKETVRDRWVERDGMETEKGKEGQRRRVTQSEEL